jgi:hypothetical protein
VWYSPDKEANADEIKHAVKLDGHVVQFWIQWFIENHAGFQELKIEFDQK